MTELSLARAFPTPKESDWQRLVTEALKGAPLASLRSTSYDGIAIEPLYAPAREAALVPGRSPGNPWGVVQRVDLSDPKAANAQIVDDLMNGASGLALVFEGSVGNYGYALAATPMALAETLEGVHLDAGIGIELNLGPNCKDAALMLADLVQARGIAPERVNIRFGFDPLGVLATNGWNAMPWSAMAPILAALITDL
jgi:methylmalonyl-CoA mutase